MLKKCLLLTLGAVLALAFFVPAGQVFAAESDSVTITVTISQTIGVEVSEDTYDFGILSPDAAATSATSLTVTNTGSGVNETYSLSCSDTADWTCGSSPGNEVFVLRARFNSSAPADFGANDILGTTPVVADGTHFAGNETGANVPYGAVRHLWLRLQTPTMTSSSDQQSIVLTITASAS